MGKYSLGKVDLELSKLLNKKDLYIDVKKVSKIESDMEKQLESIRVSLININNLLNVAAKSEFVKGQKANSLKSWAKKAKSQSLSADKLKEKLNILYSQDFYEYPLKLLNDRIAELEKRIASMGE